MSSLIVVEGDPATIQLVIGPNSDLWDAVESAGRFVVHICREGDTSRSEVFAGLRPSPGGPFAGSRTEQSDWGPVLLDLPDRAYCTSQQREEIGYSGLVTGSIDRIEVSDMTDPLSYFRGRYRSLR